MSESAHDLALDLASAWGRLERQLTATLSALRGISFGEFRILDALERAPGRRLKRVDLAERVGLTASGLTRALRPLEKIGVVTTERSERDSRLALAALTQVGRRVVAQSRQAVDEVVVELAGGEAPSGEALLDALLRR